MPENWYTLILSNDYTQHFEFVAVAILYDQADLGSKFALKRGQRLIFENECTHSSVSMWEWFFLRGHVFVFSPTEPLP